MSRSILRAAPKIEGGFDAVAIGGGADGLAAAALMASAGLHVVHIAGDSANERQEIAPGFYYEPGDPVAAALDQATVEALDLYRHGLSFVRRRLETVLRFSDGAALVLPADPFLLHESVDVMSSADGERFAAFIEDAQARARSLRGWFAGGPPLAGDPETDIARSASFDEMIAGRFADRRLEDYLRTEASLGAAARPSEPYSYVALLQRLAGEAAGLQGGLALIEGGEGALLAALRRAAQAAGVEFRQTGRVSGVIVEWDAAAGVSFDDGGQIRAPIIVSALSAIESFEKLIGRGKLDIEFANFLETRNRRIASARAHIAIDGPLQDGFMQTRRDRRFVFAPSEIELIRAWRHVDDSGAGAPLLAEVVFPSAFDESLAPDGSSTATMLLHPVAESGEAAWRETVEKAAIATLERLSRGASSQIAGVRLEAPVPAFEPITPAIARRERLATSAGVSGYFFCGPEARLGRSLSLLPAKRAAEAAIDFHRARRRER